MSEAKELRKMLEFALKEKNKAAATSLIRVAVADGEAIESMTELHFSLLLLLASPDIEKRGRKKDKDLERGNWCKQWACKLKSHLSGESYSKTWAAYMDSRREAAPNDEPWRCAGILEYLVDAGDRAAIAAIKAFELTKGEISEVAQE